jgi:uncharacterized protein (DUF3084 family)
MAPRITYEIVKQVFQDVLVPQLEQISGKLEDLKIEMRSIRTEMRGEAQTVRSEVQMAGGDVPSVRNETHGLEKRMEEGFASIRNELAATNKRLDDALDVRERLAVLEGEMSARTN